jgi:hypothetical protein
MFFVLRLDTFCALSRVFSCNEIFDHFSLVTFTASSPFETVWKSKNAEQMSFNSIPHDCLDEFTRAARLGGLETMKLLHSSGCDLEPEIFTASALNKNRNNILWLKEINCPCDSWTMTAAVQYGDVDNLFILRSHIRSPRDYHTLTLRLRLGI